MTSRWFGLKEAFAHPVTVDIVIASVFHYVGYFRGFGLDQPTRIITGS
jgi:hypothetical protein